MSLYRCAFLLCRALSLFLGIEAAIDLMAVVASFGLRLVGVFIVYSNFVSPVVTLAAAVGVSLFAQGISASLVGESVLQGEAIRADQKLTAEERSMLLGFVGVFLLSLGFIGGATSVFNGVMMFLFTPSSRPALLSPFAYYGVPVGVASIKIIVGFYLAFLRRFRDLF